MPASITKGILDFISSSFAMTATVYIWYNLLGKKMRLKNLRNIITILSLTIISIVNFYIVNRFIRIFCITLILILFFRFLFKEKLSKTIITPIYQQIFVMLSETIIIFILVVILKLNPEELHNEYLNNFVVNIITTICTVILVKLPITKKIYSLILISLEKINRKFFIIASLLIIGIANVLTTTTYNNIDFRWIIIINVVFTLFCFIIVLYSFRMQSNLNKVSDKYNVAINSLTDYEQMMAKYRIENHENKNLLLTIRAMIVNKEKDIPKYIDSIVKDKYEDNEKLLLKTSVIPSGGLRATIYSEILKIKENNINYSLNIDKNLKTVDLIELDTDMVIDICKIVCVFIDNAIEEVKNLKTKNIQIAMYLQDEFLNIKVSNNYNGKINVDKIFDEGYTTKGKGHGYGLVLVKKIVDNNKRFLSNAEISKEVFSQILSIKIKKHIK